MTYTVTFLDSNSGNWEISRYFRTLRAARSWARWLRTTRFVKEAAVYRGPAGGERLE